ncbi:hypothetical protein ACTXT7_006113 [Hymenolepis weldensis]
MLLLHLCPLLLDLILLILPHLQKFADPAGADDATKMSMSPFMIFNQTMQIFICDKFRFGTLTEEQFRCLIFISGLQTKPRFSLRTRLLKIMEKNPKREAARNGQKRS